MKLVEGYWEDHTEEQSLYGFDFNSCSFSSYWSWHVTIVSATWTAACIAFEHAYY